MHVLDVATGEDGSVLLEVEKTRRLAHGFRNFTNGAVVALLVAMHRPDLVDRLVLIGQYYNSSGKVTNGIVDQLLGGGDEVMACLRGGYDPFHRTARSSAATRTAGGSPGYASLADGDSESGECAADLVPRWR